MAYVASVNGFLTLGSVAPKMWQMLQNYQREQFVDDFLTPPDIAKLLKVSSSTVRRLIDSGAIPSTRLTEDSWRRVERQDFAQYAQDRGIRIDWSVLDGK